MTTKTFKIGESAKGGVITVEVRDTVVTVIGRDWDYSKGSNKGSDQSNAKEFIRETFDTLNDNVYRQLSFFLCDLTTSYYSELVIDWIVSKTGIKKSFGW